MRDLLHITDTDVILAADVMPVCLHGDRLTFTRDVVVCDEILGTIELVSQEKAGNSWDGATIPRLFWGIIGKPLSPEFRWASFWHDRLCERAFSWSQRRLADAVLLALLDREYVAYWRRTAMWAAVRLYAWTIWSWRRRR